MSMIGCFRAIGDGDLAALWQRPERIARLLFEEAPGSASDEWQPAEAAEQTDVDKAWHGIHFLLCGDPEEGDGPLGFILGGGQPIGDVDVGYGPAYGLTSAEVARVADALRPIDEAELERRFDAERFADEGIYPEIWDEPIEDCLGYLVDYFGDLKAFVLRTAERGQGMLVWLS